MKVLEFLDPKLTEDPALIVSYTTGPGNVITKSDLLEFRDILDQDDVFQPEFCSNIVFYGPDEVDFTVFADASELVSEWKTETRTFVTAKEGSSFIPAPGPYVVTDGRTWQPWRIYHDSNATIMTAFKPDSVGSRR